ncbi:methyltransferase [Dysgonomonas sp. OttesenSCG-928-M03]|nr:methyltransferase [Dysgonomonas sp. OttesenSCG-928-M03]
MPNPYFKFKKFTVYHDKCAMKVGTDGVLLGIWTELSDCNTILDIGTGSGLIALILAQRSEGRNTSIDAIDIDRSAILQAMENVEHSPFENIFCVHNSIQEYAPRCNKKYDLIVSNPPYFSSSLLSPDEQRTLARHSTALDISDFIFASRSLLSERGRISLIFPYTEKNTLIDIAQNAGLSASRITTVYPTPASLPKRVLIEFTLADQELKETQLIIEKERHVYSPEFTELAKDFYLKL